MNLQVVKEQETESSKLGWVITKVASNLNVFWFIIIMPLYIVYPHLEFWLPQIKKNIVELEKVQRRATKIESFGLEHLLATTKKRLLWREEEIQFMLISPLAHCRVMEISVDLNSLPTLKLPDLHPLLDAACTILVRMQRHGKRE